MIDRELVTRKLVLIAEDLPAAEGLARQPLEEYLASPTSEVLAERYLERKACGGSWTGPRRARAGSAQGRDPGIIARLGMGEG